MDMVTTGQGILHGIQKEEYSVFYSVPYARPPIGNRRFSAPEPPEKYEGIREAVSPLACPWMPPQPLDTPCGQEFYFDPEYHVKNDEDSLFVHIWTPACICISFFSYTAGRERWDI